MYFCIWNRFSKPFLCRSENTARRIIPLRGFPLELLAHGNVPGSGNTAVGAPELPPGVPDPPEFGVETKQFEKQ